MSEGCSLRPLEGSNVDSILVDKLLKRFQFNGFLLLQDEVSQNLQEQDDEMMALEAIYGDSFRALDTSNRCYKIELTMQVERGDSIEVSLDIGPQIHKFKVKYLPPITLAYIYPRTYPSQSLPLFLLESHWLPSDKLVMLSHKLQKIWQEQEGLVVVYAWAEFIHSEGASKQLMLNPSKALNDPRVMVRCVSPEKSATIILQYNEEMQIKSFLDSFHVCNICLTEYSGKEFVKIPCEHIYCRGCMKQHVSIHVTEGGVANLKCPTVDCRAWIPPFILKELLDVAGFERWERLSLQKALNAMPDVVYCPRCETACIKNEDHHAICGKCMFTFCGLCRGLRHSGVCSRTVQLKGKFREELASLQVQLQERGHTKTIEEQEKEDLLNEIKTLQEISKSSTQCPTCGIAITKEAGCNKMRCLNCGAIFCFKCGRTITGYDHFGVESCVLFEREDIRKWEQNPTIDGIPLHELQAPLHELQDLRRRYMNDNFVMPLSKSCPSCNTMNTKPGRKNHLWKNHMYCKTCGIRYCFECSKEVTDPDEHFGPEKCNMYSYNYYNPRWR